MVFTSASIQIILHQHLSNIIYHIISYNNKTLKWIISLIWYSFQILFSPLYCVLCNEMKKTRSHLHIFFKINKLTHHYFKSLSFICNSWNDNVIFLFFDPVRFSSAQTGIIYSLSPLRCHTSFPLCQDERATSASSFSNALSRRLPPRTKIKVLNLYHYHRLPYSDRPTHTLYYSKNVISILVTPLTPQPCIHFVSSLARAPRRWSCIYHHRSLLLPFHAYCPSAQRHPRWRTSRPSFAF
jgi:hypothetical protein